MVRSSNLTRHGDEIIERVKDATGQVRFVAKRQFQQFLDEVGDVINIININDGTTITSDSTQQNAATDATIHSRFSDLLNKTSLLKEQAQEIQVNGSNISTLIAENSRLKKQLNGVQQGISDTDSLLGTLKAQNGQLVNLINNNNQLILEQKSLIDTLQEQSSRMAKKKKVSRGNLKATNSVLPFE